MWNKSTSKAEECASRSLALVDGQERSQLHCFLKLTRGETIMSCDIEALKQVPFFGLLDDEELFDSAQGN